MGISHKSISQPSLLRRSLLPDAYPLPSSRHRLSSDDCPEATVRGNIIRTVLCCIVRQLCTVIRTQVLNGIVSNRHRWRRKSLLCPHLYKLRLHTSAVLTNVNLQTSIKVSPLPVCFCRLVTLCQRLRFVLRFWRYIN